MTQRRGLTACGLTTGLLTANILSYFAALQAQGRIQRAHARMLDQPALSCGLFHAAGQPRQLFQIATTGLDMKGVMMDVGHLRHMRWHQADDTTAWKHYNRLRGQYASALEGGIPERMFIDPASCNAAGSLNPDPNKPACPRAVSGASAIAIAEGQGQRVYAVSAQNLASALPNIQAAADVKAEIADAVNAGKEVMIDQSPIEVDGWHASGYAVVDPETGVGSLADRLIRADMVLGP